MPKTAPGRWGQNQMATLLGFTPATWSHILSGMLYPARLQHLQRIAIVLGWPVEDQVKLIPPYWEWPDQAQSEANGRRYYGEPTDLRYAMKLSKVVSEWAEANPRTVPSKEIQMHPSIKPLNKTPRQGWHGSGKPGVKGAGNDD